MFAVRHWSQFLLLLMRKASTPTLSNHMVFALPPHSPQTLSHSHLQCLIGCCRHTQRQETWLFLLLMNHTVCSVSATCRLNSHSYCYSYYRSHQIHWCTTRVKLLQQRTKGCLNFLYEVYFYCTEVQFWGSCTLLEYFYLIMIIYTFTSLPVTGFSISSII